MSKVLNTRIQQKYDTEEQWEKVKDSFIPLDGEVVIYAHDELNSNDRIKIGDGKTTLENLDFAYVVKGPSLTPIKVPRQKDSLTYNGSAQKPVWEDYDPNQIELLYIDASNQIDAGDYTVECVLRAGYCWEDGTTDTKTVNWRIQKKVPEYCRLVDPETNEEVTQIVMTDRGVTTQLKMICESGIYGAWEEHDYSGDNGIVSYNFVTLADGSASISLTPNNLNGTCTITFENISTKNYDRSTVTLTIVNEILVINTEDFGENSWELINEISQQGNASDYWEIGAMKAITLNGAIGQAACNFTNETFYVYIIDFNHDNMGGIQFGTFKTADGTNICLVDGMYGRYYDINDDSGDYFMMHYTEEYSGWQGTELRYDILGSPSTAYTADTLMGALSPQLRAVLKPMTIYTREDAVTNDSVDYLPLLSDIEVGLASERYNQSVYTYYNNGNPKVKYKDSSTTTAALWWLRSGLEGLYSVVNENGAAMSMEGTYCCGIAPIFTV